jgi:SAM-dependent methyltransferase
MTDRWQGSGVPRGAAYDRRFEDLAAGGFDVHGEAALVDSYRPDAVLDAGCGTGRVAIELSRRGYFVVGVDVDPVMLEVAHAKAPDLTWVEGDLTDPEIANAARWLAPAGRLVAGYSVRPGSFGPAEHDVLASRCGLVLEDRWSTWDRRPFGSGDYAVSVHRRGD